MNLLMVLSSHGQLDAASRKLGFGLEEFVIPYYAFRDAGARVALASPLGGQPWFDPASDYPASQSLASRRFRDDAVAHAALGTTTKLCDVAAGHFNAVFYPGGPGSLWDLAENVHSIRLIRAMLVARKPVAAVCHAPGVLRHVKAVDGRPMVEGRAVTGCSNTEEAGAGLSDFVPFSVEEMLRHSGGRYSKAAEWQPHVVTAGLLITGQNPASSQAAAVALLALLAKARQSTVA